MVTKSLAKPAKPAKSVKPLANPAPAAPAEVKPPVAKPAAVKPAAAVEPPKPKRNKLVRDSFTMPKNEYEVIAALKERSAKMGAQAKKSELLRAGIIALAALSDARLQAALSKVPAIKTGRPKETK